MTQGGPLNATKTIVMYVYEQAFNKNYYGRAAAGGKMCIRDRVLVDLVKAEDITAASNDLLAFAKDFGAAEAAAEGEKEIEAIASSRCV